VMTIALQAIVDAYNRIAAEAETQAQAGLLKSRIAQLEMDLASGKIDEETYTALASAILAELPPPPEGVRSEGGL
jgi:hypothetical protein